MHRGDHGYGQFAPAPNGLLEGIARLERVAHEGSCDAPGLLGCAREVEAGAKSLTCAVQHYGTDVAIAANAARRIDQAVQHVEGQAVVLVRTVQCNDGDRPVEGEI